MLHKYTLHIFMVVCTLCIVVNGQELSQPVCTWNETAQSCQQNATAAIDLLTRMEEPFGFMMRCEYAGTKQICDNIPNNTCVWAQNRCRVSAQYLADAMQGCLDVDLYTFNNYQKCKEDLQERVSGLQWVDYSKLSYYSECYSFVSSSPTCRLIDNAHNCAQYSLWSNCVGNQYQPQGGSLSKDIQYLLDQRSSSMIVEISEIESELGIKLGNLQLYDYCNILDNSSCEALDSNLLQYLLPPPPPPSPPSLPSPPSPPPPQPQQELETALCEWDSRSSNCKQSPSSLVDLLVSTNSTFANMMSCSFIESASECNNTANGACVWDQNFCHIAATYLVDTLIDCLYPQSNFPDIEECKQQMKSVSLGQNWIDRYQYTTANFLDKCEDIQGFSYNEPSCILLDAALNCDSSYYGYCSRYYSYSRSTVEYQLGNNLTSQVKYLMDRSFSRSYVLDLVYLEENLNIKSGNLKTYDSCYNKRNKYDCEISILTSSPSPSYYSQYSPRYTPSPWYYQSPSSRSRNNDNSSSVSGGGIFGIILGLVLPCCVCGCLCYAKEQNRQNVVTQTGTGSTGVQAQVQLAQPTPQVEAAQNAPDGVQTTAIIANLPTLEYTRQGDGESSVICAICMEDLQQGDQSTVLPCAHWYHKSCIEQWTETRGRNAACPLCNQRVQDNTIAAVASS